MGISTAFARLAGYTPRQVNNWCRGRATVPPWAAALHSDKGGTRERMTRINAAYEEARDRTAWSAPQ